MTRMASAIDTLSGKGFGSVIEQHVRKRLGHWLLGCLALTMAVGCGPAEPELGDATEHFLAAQDALAKGDQQLALQELDASLALRPDAWAFYQRARIHSEMKQDDKALADVQSGLEIDPEHVQLKWLQGELKKPAEQRFQGRNKEPPVTK